MKKAKGRLVLPEIDLSVSFGTAGGDVKATKFEIKDGQIIKTATKKCFTVPEQDIYSEQLVNFLNMEIAFDKGSWRVVWCNPARSWYNPMSGMWLVWVPQTMECQYVDKDGDVLALVDFEENVFDLLQNFSFTDIAGLCHDAYEQFRELERDIDIQDQQRYSPSHGETSVDPDLQVPGLF